MLVRKVRKTCREASCQRTVKLNIKFPNKIFTIIIIIAESLAAGGLTSRGGGGQLIQPKKVNLEMFISLVIN